MNNQLIRLLRDFAMQGPGPVSQLSPALEQLQAAGLIELTRQGDVLTLRARYQARLTPKGEALLNQIRQP